MRMPTPSVRSADVEDGKYHSTANRSNVTEPLLLRGSSSVEVGAYHQWCLAG